MSRDTAWIWDSEGVLEGRGLGSKAARLPRSNVTGMAFVIVSAASSIVDVAVCQFWWSKVTNTKRFFSQPII